MRKPDKREKLNNGVYDVLLPRGKGIAEIETRIAERTLSRRRKIVRLYKYCRGGQNREE